MREQAALAWIRLPHGPRRAVDAEMLCRDLFAAVRGDPTTDPFQTRELADGVAHFLGQDADREFTADEFRAHVGQLLRQLGQRPLAEQYERLAAPTPPSVPPDPRTAMMAWSLAEVYPPEIAAAHRAGWIELGGLDTPTKLAASVADCPPQDGWLALLQVAERTGQRLAFAGANIVPAELSQVLRYTGLSATVNLGADETADDTPTLFASPRGPAVSVEQVQAFRAVPGCTVIWHVDPTDTTALATAGPLLAEPRLQLAFARSRRPAVWGDGLDATRPAVLLEATVVLDKLLAVGGGPDRLLRRLGSLARLLKSAARARQDFLRQHGTPALRGGFQLERAGLLVRVAGLTAVCTHFTSVPPCELPGLVFAQQIIETLRAELATAAPRSIAASLDGPLLAPADTTARVEASAAVQASAGGGVTLLGDVRWVRHAAQHTGTLRVQGAFYGRA